jgi:hypothetical protein
LILTVTLNAALDITYRVPRLRPSATHRVAEVSERPGGKGLNVARVLAALGHRAVVTGFAGGATGEALRELLAAAQGAAGGAPALEGPDSHGGPRAIGRPGGSGTASGPDWTGRPGAAGEAEGVGGRRAVGASGAADGTDAAGGLGAAIAPGAVGGPAVGGPEAVSGTDAVGGAHAACGPGAAIRPGAVGGSAVGSPAAVGGPEAVRSRGAACGETTAGGLDAAGRPGDAGRPGAAGGPGHRAGGLVDALTPIAGTTRRTVGIVDAETGDTTQLNEPGPTITRAEWDAFLCTYTALLPQAEAVALCGSLPPGLPVGTYGRLIREAQAARVPVLLDTGGERRARRGRARWSR